MSKAFILNDYMVDFIAEEGKLFSSKDAQRIGTTICEYMDKFIAAGDYIAVCLDTHTEGDPFHPETALFPMHNIKGSTGHQLYGDVGQKVEEIKKTNPSQITIIEKSRYSAFVGTHLDIWLRSRGVNEITVSGIFTDICVLHTVIDAYGRGYKIILPRAVCYSNNKDGVKFALKHMREAMGVLVV